MFERGAEATTRLSAGRRGWHGVVMHPIPILSVLLLVVSACSPSPSSLDGGVPVGPCNSAPGSLDAPLLAFTYPIPGQSGDRGVIPGTPGHLDVINRDGSARASQVVPGDSLVVLAWYPLTEHALLLSNGNVLWWDTVAGQGSTVMDDAYQGGANVMVDRTGHWLLRSLPAPQEGAPDLMEVWDLGVTPSVAAARSVELVHVQGGAQLLRWLDKDTVLLQNGSWMAGPNRQVLRWDVRTEQVDVLWTAPEQTELLTLDLDTGKGLLLSTERPVGFFPTLQQGILAGSTTRIINTSSGAEVATLPGAISLVLDAQGVPAGAWVRWVDGEGVYVMHAGTQDQGSLLPGTTKADGAFGMGTHVYVPMPRAQPPVLRVIPLDGSGPGWETAITLRPGASAEQLAATRHFVGLGWASPLGKGVRFSVMWFESDVGSSVPPVFAGPDCRLAQLSDVGTGPAFLKWDDAAQRSQILLARDDGSLVHVGQAQSSLGSPARQAVWP